MRAKSPRAWLAAVLAAVLQCSLPVDGHAMQFRTLPGKDGTIVIDAVGPIISGDFQRWRGFLEGLPNAVQISGVVLDSPGGDVVEAERIAQVLHTARVTVGVISGAQCVSACFLLFASGTRRVAAADALIGVHGTSINGQENILTMGATTALARDVAALDVPPAIIGKLVSTPPNRVEWLTPEDEASMGVRIMPAPPAGQTVAYVAPAPAPPAPQTQATPAGQTQAPAATRSDAAPSGASSSFAQGLADRQVYEHWFTGLDAQVQAGAAYWAARRSDSRPGACTELAQPALISGCRAAQQRLAQADIRRRAEPEYRRGWNSL